MALGSIQILGYLLPIVTLPYLTRVLGAEVWGLVAYLNVSLSYFSLLINWGFSLSGTQKIAACRDDTHALSKFFFAAWGAQWVLATLAFAILTFLLLHVEFFIKNKEFLQYGFLVFLATVVFPVWFFTGLERLKEIAFVQFVIRVMAVPLIFILVKTPADGPLLIAIPALLSIIGGLVSLRWIHRELNLTWAFPKFFEIKLALADGLRIFLSMVWVNTYQSLNILILGALVGPVAVAHYSLADKVKVLAQTALLPVSQAIFPRLANLFANDPNAATKLLKKSSIFLIAASASGSGLIWLLSDWIVLTLGGAEFASAGNILRWLSFAPLFVAISTIFGAQIMIPRGMTKHYSNILFSAGVLSLLMIGPLVISKGAQGAAMTLLIVEFSIMAVMGFYLYKAGFFRTKAVF